MITLCPPTWTFVPGTNVPEGIAGAIGAGALIEGGKAVGGKAVAMARALSGGGNPDANRCYRSDIGNVNACLIRTLSGCLDIKPFFAGTKGSEYNVFSRALRALCSAEDIEFRTFSASVFRTAEAPGSSTGVIRRPLPWDRYKYGASQAAWVLKQMLSLEPQEQTNLGFQSINTMMENLPRVDQLPEHR